jgi:hypothetical protein
MIQRVVLPVALAAALLAGAWLLWSRAARLPQPLAPPAPTATSSPVRSEPSPTAEPVNSGSEFRLSGTAVGDPASYAAIEAPDGTSRLYRDGETVAGLGRIAAVHTDRVIVVDSAGESLVLRLKPAPTPTPERRRTSVDGATPTVSPARDDTPRESPSSNAPDRPAS